MYIYWVEMWSKYEKLGLLDTIICELTKKFTNKLKLFYRTGNGSSLGNDLLNIELLTFNDSYSDMYVHETVKTFVNMLPFQYSFLPIPCGNYE